MSSLLIRNLPPDGVVQSLAEILRDSETAIQRFHDPAPFSRHQVVLAPCSPFSVSADLLRETATLARHYGVRLHTHLAETVWRSPVEPLTSAPCWLPSASRRPSITPSSPVS